MKKLILSLMIGSIGIGLIGCAEKVKTVEYYMAHESEAMIVQKDCMKDKNLVLKEGTNCYNAIVATSKLQNHRMFDNMTKKGSW